LQVLLKDVGRTNVSVEVLDAVNDVGKMQRLVAEADVVVSLLPATMHIPVAEACIASGTPFANASYVSDAMRALDTQAEQAGVPLLCEMGLDPGMDHMSAMKIIDEVTAEGGRIDSFVSLCGGLPAPEAANNPLRYKFSWSPEGVLSAAQNDARFRRGGHDMLVPGAQLLTSAQNVDVFPALALEHIPNRDSLPYGDIYGIADAKTIYRGTLRYSGWCSMMYEFSRVGLMSKEGQVGATTWGKFASQLGSLDSEADSCLRWLGGHSDLPIDPTATPVTAFCDLLRTRLWYGANERDMAAMYHEFKVSFPDGRAAETRTSSLLEYGVPGGSTIMAKTVGLTVAVGAEIALGGKLDRKGGVQVPTTADIYNPALEMLAAEGLTFTDAVK
jgi:alpha-aminoadipic semialdehyde synthase